MSNKLITMVDIRSIISLSQKGFSIRRISQQMRLSRNTVATYLERFKASSFTAEELLKMDDAGFSAITYASARAIENLFKNRLMGNRQHEYGSSKD